MSCEQNKQTVTDFFDAFSKGNKEAALALLDEAVTWQAMGTIGGDPMSITRNKQEIGALLTQMKQDLKDGLQLTPLAWTCENDRVALEMEGMGNVIATGKAYHNFYHFLIILEQNKITTIKEYMDTLHVKCVFVDK